MEVERLKALEQYEERDRQRGEERRRGAAIIREQLAGRERERVRQEELREMVRGCWGWRWRCWLVHGRGVHRSWLRVMLLHLHTLKHALPGPC
jgi:hypothetical protein